MMAEYGPKIDTFRSPPGAKECREAVWSQGGSCRECAVECYRRGWSKRRATADNERLVAAK